MFSSAIKAFQTVKVVSHAVSKKFSPQMHGKHTQTSREMPPIAPIVSTFRQSLVTFSCDRDQDTFMNNLMKLKQSMDNLTADDVGLDPVFSEPSLWTTPDKPPCTYIRVFENEDVNMSIFILRPGYKMPLHDHPDMYGLLKVISGSVRIRSYNRLPSTHESAVGAASIIAASSTMHIENPAPQSWSRRRMFFAELTNDCIVKYDSQTCLLTPQHSNYHEIEALEYPAAFFDILGPPYDSYMLDGGVRECGYYKILHDLGKIVQLQETGVPVSYRCDEAPYSGPLLA